ncbi:MAG: hypothetical protein KU37_02230 [Sulfuricurvum sp. PC08-66]|nr:MAG: hypothetical protein KU37_02230 [Sulfuricurvum sp. PC08-66]
MRILLINKSPVVGKLVTLSAQKSGDELTVADSIENAPSESFDLLLIDDEFYNTATLGSMKATFAKKVLIANRGEVKPEGFIMLLEKPFLPTDLVEMLIALDDTKGEAMSPKTTKASTPSDELSMDDLSLDGGDDLGNLDSIGDLGDFGDDIMGDLEGLDDLSDHDSALSLEDDGAFTDTLDDDFGLEDAPAKKSEKPKEEAIDDAFDLGDDLDLGDDVELGDTTSSDLDEESSLFDAKESTKGGVLDEDEISEVKGLLEEDDELHESKEESDTAMLSGVDDDDDFGDLLDGVEGLADESADVEGFDFEDEELDAPEKNLDAPVDTTEDFSFDDEDLDAGLLDDNALDQESVSEAEVAKSAKDEDDLNMDDALDDTLDDTLDFEEVAHDDEDDELDLKIAGGEFASLTEEALSEALGEKIDMGDDLEDVDLDAFEMEDVQEVAAPAKPQMAPATPTIQEKVTTPTASSKADAGAEVLKALLHSMESGALKGAKISINITVGGE